MTIVITGGPGSGKTTLINALKQKQLTCFDEVSREITENARHLGIDQLFLEQPLLFSELLLEARKKQFEKASKMNDLVFLDRGLPDILAYMHFIGDAYPTAFKTTCENYKYDKVFILTPWREIYVQDEHRYENFEQAELIFKYLIETYKAYNYNIVEVPKGTIEERIAFIFKHL